MEKLDIMVIDNLMYAYIKLWSITDNKYDNVFVLIDTGAHTTIFSEFVLEGLGCMSYDKSKKLRTAGGSITAHEVTASKIQIGNVELKDVDIHAYDFSDDFTFDGILGMNILSKFNFHVNFDDGFIELEKRNVHQDYCLAT